MYMYENDLILQRYIKALIKVKTETDRLADQTGLGYQSSVK